MLLSHNPDYGCEVHMALEELLLNYGYAIIVMGTFFEGETVVIVAGFLARRGYLDLPWVVTAAFIGTLIGDQLVFFLGRKKGMPYLACHQRWQAKADRILRLLREHQNWVAVGFRFLYGFRTVTPFLIGASGITPPRFLVLNSIGAAAWALSVGGLGYAFGEMVELILKDVKRYELMIIGLILLIGLGFWLFRFRRSRLHHRHER